MNILPVAGVVGVTVIVMAFIFWPIGLLPIVLAHFNIRFYRIVSSGHRVIRPLRSLRKTWKAQYKTYAKANHHSSGSRHAGS